MSDVTINYKGSSIATMDASGTKTLLTEGKYCEDDIEVVYMKPGGGVHTGTFTPTARTNTITIDIGITTLQGLIIVPTSETPLKSGGKTCIAVIIIPNAYYKYVTPTSNNAGSSWLTPAYSTTNTFTTLTGTVAEVTLSSGSGYFENVSYTWFAW